MVLSAERGKTTTILKTVLLKFLAIRDQLKGIRTTQTSPLFTSLVFPFQYNFKEF